MACGSCGKGRAGTAAVKERKRSSAGDAMISSKTTSTVPNTPDYNDRLNNYLRDRQNFRRGQ